MFERTVNFLKSLKSKSTEQYHALKGWVGAKSSQIYTGFLKPTFSKLATSASRTSLYIKLSSTSNEWVLNKADMSIKALKVMKRKEYSRTFGDLRRQLIGLLQSDQLSPRLKPYFRTLLEDDLLEVNTQTDPPQVSVLKNTLNLLFEVESRLQEIESLNIPRSASEIVALGHHLQKRFYSALSKAWEMSEFVAHLLADSSEGIGGHIVEVLQLCIDTKKLIARQIEPGLQQGLGMTTEQAFRQAGAVSGTLVQQFERQGGSYDYGSIAQLSTLIPLYLNSVTEYVNSYSKKVPGLDNQLDEVRKQDLQRNAMNIAHSFNRLRQGTSFLSVKLYHLIRIFQSANTIVMAIVEQAGRVNESLEQFMHDKLAELNGNLLPKVIQILSGIEVELLLKPGTLTTPAMEKLEEMYSAVVRYSETVIEFRPEVSELKTLKHKHFIDACILERHQAVAQANTQIMQIDHVKKIAEHFFAILHKDQYQKPGFRLCDLSERTKHILLQHYKQFVPYVCKIDAKLNKEIVKSLTEDKSFLDRHTSSVRLCIDKVSNVLGIEEKLFQQMEQDKGRYELQGQFAIDQINEGFLAADESIWTNEGSAFTGVFVIDEREVFSEDVLDELQFIETEEGFVLKDLSQLSEEEILRLYYFHELNLSELETAEEAWVEMSALLEAQDSAAMTLKEIDAEERQKLLKHWLIAAPYIRDVLVLSGEDEAYCLNWTQKIYQALKNPECTVFEEIPEIRCSEFRALSEPVDIAFNQSKETMHTSLREISEYYKVFKRETALEQSIILDYEPRADYIVKHTRLSETLIRLREKLSAASRFFNEDINQQLQAADLTGTPFPEAENAERASHNGSPVLMLKRFHNILHHLQSTCGFLEKLTQDDFNAFFHRGLNAAPPKRLYDVVYVVNDLTQIYFSLFDMCSDPYFSILEESIHESLTQCREAVSEFISPHIAGQFHSENEPLPTRSGIYYGLNTLFVLPDQVAAMANGVEFSERHVRDVHAKVDQVAKEVQAIVDNSDSYFKLFVSTPEIYRLFKSLCQKLYQLTDVTHEAVSENLQYINEALLTKLLIQADQWEENLGLKPGIVSERLEAISGAFYQGLLSPFGFVSENYIALATSRVPIEQRIQENQVRSEENAFNIERTEAHLGLLNQFLASVKAFRETKTVYGMTSQRCRSVRETMISNYSAALPLLLQERGRIDEEGFMHQLTDTDLDDLLNAEAGGPPIAHVEAFAIKIQEFFQGMHSTWTSKQHAIEEKEASLERQYHNHETDVEAFRTEYTRHGFKRLTSERIASNVEFELVSEEYKERLGQWFEAQEEEIVQQTRSEADIETALSNAIQASEAAFQSRNRVDFLKLENLTKQVGAFRSYFEKAEKSVNTSHFSFENRDTLALKKDAIEQLEAILKNNASTSIRDRLAQASRFVEQPYFTQTMLSHHRYNSFTFKGLWQGILSLLSCLGLRKLEHEKLHDQLRGNCNAYRFFEHRAADPNRERPVEEQQEALDQIPVPAAYPGAGA